MNRIAVVTGGTKGIGQAIAKTLKANGYQIAATYHGDDEAAIQFQEKNGIPVYKWDVANFDACMTGVQKIENDIGPVDVLINNAGITRDGMLHKMTMDQWSMVINTNLGSVFNMCRAVIEGMRERHFGRILNISSINGQKGQVGQVNYAAAKAGILGFTKALALEGARKNITVNAIAPGYCETDMVAAVPKEFLQSIVDNIPIGRLGSPEDIARLAAFLVQDEAGFITGATFSVNGGQYMC